MRRRVAVCILLGIILWVGRIQSQQNNPGMDERTKARVKQLRAISDAIKACPSKEETLDTGNAKFIYGPPSNVTWDVKANPSIRAPYLGYIEFSVSRDFSASKKYCAQHSELCARMLLQSSVPLRFEFDLGPDGLELMKILAKNKDKDEDKDWNDIKPNAAVLSDTCWLKAAHAGETR